MPKQRSRMMLYIALLPLAYILFVALLYFNQRSYIYFPDTAQPQTPAGAVNVDVTTEDGLTLRGWYFPPRRDDNAVLLMFHGNAGHIGHRLYKLPMFTLAGYGVLLAEYRGYGDNPGVPTESGLYMDARAYYDWLIAQGVKAEQIILHGESLGTGVAVHMASRVSSGGLVLETPYARLSDPAAKAYPIIPFIHALMHDTYDSIDKIGAVTVPKLFIVAGQDELLGPETGLRLYEAAPEPKTLMVLESSGHSNHYNHGAGEAILEFLKGLESVKTFGYPAPRSFKDGGPSGSPHTLR